MPLNIVFIMQLLTIRIITELEQLGMTYFFLCKSLPIFRFNFFVASYLATFQKRMMSDY